jgi:hypothetical protein
MGTAESAFQGLLGAGVEVKSDAMNDLDLHAEGLEDLVGVLAEASDPAIGEAGLTHRGVDRRVVL